MGEHPQITRVGAKAYSLGECLSAVMAHLTPWVPVLTALLGVHQRLLKDSTLQCA